MWVEWHLSGSTRKPFWWWVLIANADKGKGGGIPVDAQEKPPMIQLPKWQSCSYPLQCFSTALATVSIGPVSDSDKKLCCLMPCYLPTELLPQVLIGLILNFKRHGNFKWYRIVLASAMIMSHGCCFRAQS